MAEEQSDPDPSAIASNVSGKKAEILLAFQDHVVLNSKDIREATDIKSTTVNHHMRRASGCLVDRGLFEFTGYDEAASTRGGGQPSEYQITPLGRRVLDVFREREIEKSVDISKFDELRDEVESLRGEVGKAKRERDRLRGKIEANEEEIGRVEMSLNDRMDGFREFLKVKLNE